MADGSTRYTFQIVINSGDDEFWEDNPSPQDVGDVVRAALENSGLDVEDLLLTSVFWKSG